MLDPTPIASADDSRLQPYRQLIDPASLSRAGLFVAEGRFVVRRLIALRRHQLHSMLVTATALEALRDSPGFSRDDAAAADVYVVDQSLMNEVVGFNIHRGCLALAHRPRLQTLDDLVRPASRRALVLEGVNNPDNVGGIFRSAAAFGVDAVVLGPGCGDPLYRKAIRTSMAATLQVPFCDAGDWPRALETLRTRGFRVLALSTDAGAEPLESVSPTAPDHVAPVVGNEGHGLTEAALNGCDARVRIRMSSAVDSLNVTVATSIAMHHLWGLSPFYC